MTKTKFNGIPLQCSCLENAMGGGAWWAAVHGVATQVVLVVKNPPADVGDIRDAGSIPGSGGSPGEVNGKPL